MNPRDPKPLPGEDLEGIDEQELGEAGSVKRAKKARRSSEQDALELTRISEDALMALGEIQDALSEDATDEAKEIAERVITEINNGLNRVADARVRRYLETRRGA